MSKREYLLCATQSESTLAQDSHEPRLGGAGAFFPACSLPLFGVCSLPSLANPRSEERVGELLRLHARAGQAAGGASGGKTPEIRSGSRGWKGEALQPLCVLC